MAQQTVTNNHILTAVEWLIEQLQAPCRGIPSHIIERAKQMEKEQMFGYIEKLYVNGESSHEFHKKEFEQYYNENYKK